MSLIHDFKEDWYNFSIIYACTSEVGCPRNKHIFFLGSNRNKQKLNLFRLTLGLFLETKYYLFGLFRLVSVFWARIETIETNRSVLKQTKKRT
jgi:hypothetical protein